MTPEPVIVLHGLALNQWWTAPLARKLKKAGYEVHNLGYPSRGTGFAKLVDDFLAPLVEKVSGREKRKVHFVVHSMGGLMVRLYAEKYGVERIGRVVMLGTPNHGSEVADYMRDTEIFQWFAGTTGQDLGTTDKSLPAQMGPVKFECGVIAGNNHWFGFPAAFLAGIPGPSDGIVSVESTKVEGMKDHITLWVDHSLMIWSADVARQAVHFLKNGRFVKA